ncbi:hypothetical protein O3Q52_52530, partial [Streptomyces sp. ActVer]|nr:hypothetical protein [Streptomyces sp. ActVer]
FHADRPGIKLVGDITCLPTAEGWLYVACWLDLATRDRRVGVGSGALIVRCGRRCVRRGGLIRLESCSASSGG